MFFGEVATQNAEGYLLAHGLSLGNRTFRKGHLLTAEDCHFLCNEGCSDVTVIRMNADEIDENEAAEQLSRLVTADEFTVEIAVGGRVNFKAKCAGLFWCESSKVLEFNRIDEALTLAVLQPWTRVDSGQLVATLKIIPFALRQDILEHGKALIREIALRVHPWKPCERPVLIQTTLPKLRAKVYEKTASVQQARLQSLGVKSFTETRVPHAVGALTTCIRQMVDQGATLILIQGASAICDRQDVIPSALEASGGEVIQMGLAVDPGNLLLLGKIEGVTVIGLPGCARSPALNGFDWVLERVIAGIQIDKSMLSELAIGGVLKDSPARGLSRVEDSRKGPWRFAVVLLAAGQSTRMGQNKLLLPWKGEATVVESAAFVGAQVQVEQYLAVVGRDAEVVSSVLNRIGFQCVENPDPKQGMGASIRIALAHLDDEIDAVVICLGDMPLVTKTTITQLIRAFDPAEGRALCFARSRGQRGNPVVVGRRFFGELSSLSGDVGARVLLDRYPHLVAAVDVDDDGILVDIDDPETYSKLRPSN